MHLGGDIGPPYRPLRRHLLGAVHLPETLGGSIDPQPFVDPTAAPYLYWKSNAGGSTQPAFIWTALLSPDGLSLASTPQSVLTQDQAWESTVEGPDMVEVGGLVRPVLFRREVEQRRLRGGLRRVRQPDRTVHETRGCSHPPLRRGDRLGPGGESLFQDPAGNWWMAYHAWDGPDSDYSYSDGDFRSLWMAPVTFSGATPVVGADQAAEGYHMFAKDGGVFTFGAARFAGSMGATPLRGAIVGGASDDATGGYWEVGADGGIFAFDAPFEGSMGGHPLDAPVVAMAPTPDGRGYWLVASDGGIFAFGDAGFFGSMGARHLDAPIVGMAPTSDGRGYWLVASDGGVFAFGDAQYFGSMGATPLAAPVVGMAAMPQGGGYWLVASDGGVFAFGDAQYFGSMGAKRISQPVVAVVAGPGSGGYWLLAADGGVFSFGDAAFLGSMGAVRLAAPVVDGSSP